MPKEHWATKLKREKAELEEENAQLKQENDRLATELQAAEAAPKAPAPPAPADGIQPRPDNIEVYSCNPDVNFVRGDDPGKLPLPILEDDEVELYVETEADEQIYTPITSSEGLVTGRPRHTWKSGTETFQKYYADTGKFDGKRITAYDPYGFLDQFPELNIVKTHRQHAECRTEEWMIRRDEEEIARQMAQTFPSTYWRMRNVKMRDIFIDGESYYDAFHSALSDLEKARVMKRFKGAFSAEYPDGNIPHERTVYGFQIVGDKRDTFQFSIACNPGQPVVVHFAGVLPDSLPMQFYVEDPDQEEVYTPGNPEGATISFMDNR